MTDARICDWCKGEIPAKARPESVCCSVRCRQARWRFARQVGRGVASAGALRLAYADPPYPGNAHLYRGHRDFAGEVDSADLIAHLCTYDGWALSTSAEALPMVLASCPPGRRVAAWMRGERPTRSAGPLNAWEPVIYFGGRALDASSIDTRRIDALVHGVAARTTDPARVVGAKPAVFARWMFDLLGAQAQDTLDDLYPGSGGITRAWEVFAGRAALDIADASASTAVTRRADPLDASARAAATPSAVG